MLGCRILNTFQYDGLSNENVLHVLVTGGAGFIGSHLCERLLSDGHSVTCLDNQDLYYDPQVKRLNIRHCQSLPSFRFVQGDILDSNAVDDALVSPNSGMETSVIHLAGLGGVRRSLERPDAYMRVNAEGTVNVLERCGRASVQDLPGSVRFFGNCFAIFHSLRT